MSDSDSPTICTIHVWKRADPETSVFVISDSDSPTICTIHVCNRADPETSVFVMSDSDSPVICTIHVCNRADPETSVFVMSHSGSHVIHVCTIFQTNPEILIIGEQRGAPSLLYGPKFLDFFFFLESLAKSYVGTPKAVWRILNPSCSRQLHLYTVN